MYSPDNIKVVENFMSTEDVESLLQECVASADNPDYIWWYQKFPGPDYTSLTTGQYLHQCSAGIEGYDDGKNPILNSYLNKVSELISYDVGKKIVPIFGLNRHEVKVGSCTQPHTDAGSKSMGHTDYLSEYSPLHIYEPCLSEYTAIIYLNNNYKGGSLYFPDYDIKIEHSPGQLVYFPADAEYVHGVTEVRDYDRWNLITHLTSPVAIQLHSLIYNMWTTMSDEQKEIFPESWRYNDKPRGIV